MAARKERRQRQELSLLPLSYLNQALLRAAFFDSLEALSAFSAVVGLGPQRWKLVSFKIGLCTSTVFPSTSLLKVLIGQSPGKKDFASFGDGLHYAFSKTVPAVNVEPESLLFVFLVAVFSDSEAEFHNFVACVSEAYSAGILSDSADYGQLIVHGRHLQCGLGAPGFA